MLRPNLARIFFRRPWQKSGEAIRLASDATKAVELKPVGIRFASQFFSISETCYRYTPKLSSENDGIADWLVRLTHRQRNWGFDLCFFYLCNVKGYGWNHKRVYRIYRELELNLRIKPKKRIVREKPVPQAVPDLSHKLYVAYQRVEKISHTFHVLYRIYWLYA